MKILERVTIVPPLGLRFQDLATGTVVQDEGMERPWEKQAKLKSLSWVQCGDLNKRDPADDSLFVVAYPAGNPLRRVEAYTNRKGVYVFRDLPGFKEILREKVPEEGKQNPNAFEQFLADNPKRRSFVVEVVDPRGRFQPFQLTIDLPRRGVFQWNLERVESPPSESSWIPLFPTPSHHVPAGKAVVRAALWDPTADRPASWALVEVIGGGKVLGRGLSGADGQVSVIFPHPGPVTPTQGSSPIATTYTSIHSQTWELSLQAYYSPEAPVAEIPDLAEVFRQVPAQLWSDFSTSTKLGIQTLEYGTELIVRSGSLSTLLITQTSPPL